MKNKRHWIEDAIEKSGAERDAAKRAGESTTEYAAKHESDPGKSGRRARLAETLETLRKKKKAQPK